MKDSQPPENQVSSRSRPAVIILAAGQGKRMKSARPKVLHELMGRTLLDHVLHAARFLQPAILAVVTGSGASEVEASLAGWPGAVPVRQAEQLGTGHAVLCAAELLAGFDGPVMVLPGDVPLISPQTLWDLLDAHQALEADLSCLTVTAEDPAAYGRILRDENGWLKGIIEARDASEEERAIREINSGLYVFDCRKLLECLKELKSDNVQSEYYLTDTAALFRARGYRAAAVLGPDPEEVQGINDRLDLARAQAVLRRRINLAWLAAGVTMADPRTVHIEASVRLGRDVTLGPGVVLTGATRLEAGVTVGPYTCLDNCWAGPDMIIGAHQNLAQALICPQPRSRRRPVRFKPGRRRSGF
ncbi:MAG: NTP transferase domain-containing protein [Deltaproteobacteria bacterium]|nr:NTP transferase domain-containing protein [Deltaproteobacteria bacterium]